MNLLVAHSNHTSQLYTAYRRDRFVASRAVGMECSFNRRRANGRATLVSRDDSSDIVVVVVDWFVVVN